MQDSSFRIYHTWDDERIKRELGERAFERVLALIDAKTRFTTTQQPPPKIEQILAKLEDELGVDPDYRLLKA